jgi:hypothetical protein
MYRIDIIYHYYKVICIQNINISRIYFIEHNKLNIKLYIILMK